MNVAARGLFAAARRGVSWSPRRPFTDRSSGSHLPFRVDDLHLLVLDVAFSDAISSASNRTLRASVGCLSWGFPKIAPPSYAAEESTPAASIAARSFETDGATACPRSVSTVFHRLDGLRLFNPAHVLQCAADHGVPGVLTVFRLSPHQTVLPSEVFSPFLAVPSR
jgi:hypothetical protein